MIETPHFSEWLNERVREHGVYHVKEPLDEEERNAQLRRIGTPLPPDYLEITRQCEGCVTGEWSIFGLSEVYECVVEDGRDFVIAEFHDRGVLTVRPDSNEADVYYW